MTSSQANSTPSFDLAPEILTALKQYEIRARLSVDHTGQVLEAWDTQLHRPVVIRQIQHLGAAGEQVLKQARLAASLKHAAFAKIHALEEVGDSLLIVTEAVNGMALKQWMQSHAGVEKKSLEHIAHIAAALAEAHQLGLVHGDIQASQFIVDQSGKIRILNCGFVSSNASYMLGSLDQIDARGGIAYLAPERFANAPASPAADVYALGCVLYEMQNSSLPFAHLQGLAMVAALVQSDPEQWPWKASLSSAESAVRKLMLDMCKRTPEQRLTCAQTVEACRTLRANDPYSGSVGSLSLAALRAQLEKAERRQKFYKLSAALLALVLLAGLGWQFKPYWPQVVKALTPYSEAREMERGIAALTRYTYSPDAKLLEQANEHFSNVLSRTPENPKAVGYISLVYLSRYHAEKRDEVWLQKAKASAQQAMQLNPNLAISLVAEAKIQHWHHKLESALELTEKALALEPENLFAWHTKMSAFFESSRFEDAIRWGEQGAKIFPQDRFLLDIKSVAHRKLNDYASSEQALRMSLKRQPDSPLAYGLLSDILELQGRSAEALQVLQQGLQVKPSAYLYGTLGSFKFSQGDYDGAATAYANAVSPEKGVAGSYLRWLQYAEALVLVSGREQEAKQAYERARNLLEIRLNRSPDDASLLVEMGLIKARFNDFGAASDLVGKALKLEPENDHVLLNAAMTFELIGQRERALNAVFKLKKSLGSFKTIQGHPIFRELRDDTRYLSMQKK